jgi:hydroxymethylpyrimidine/phosphomethylpyrimidine kinase
MSPQILPSPPMRIALSIAGSDPTGGAGLQLDLQVFRSLGVHGAGVVTALTVQDTAKVHQVLPVFPSVVLNQLRRLLEDFVPDAIKIGMLGSDDVLRSVALGLETVENRGETLPPIVIDPILAASDGEPLLERRAWDALGSLIARAALVTPNLPEAEALTGVDTSRSAGVETAARFFVEELGAGAALVKGGHREGSPDDLLARAGPGGVTLEWLRGVRVDSGRVHGTGCALSSAIAAGLARGDDLSSAVARGREFVAAALRRAESAGQGARLLVFP